MSHHVKTAVCGQEIYLGSGSTLSLFIKCPPISRAAHAVSKIQITSHLPFNLSLSTRIVSPLNSLGKKYPWVSFVIDSHMVLCYHFNWKNKLAFISFIDISCLPCSHLKLQGKKIPWQEGLLYLYLCLKIVQIPVPAGKRSSPPPPSNSLNTSWVFSNSSPFWHDLPGESSRSHMWRGQSYKTSPAPWDAGCKSRLLPVLSLYWL